MAGLASRLKRITVSRIKAFLETVDRPDLVFPHLVREIERGIGDAVNAESKAAAAFKANQRRLDESIGRSIRLGKGAEMALRQGDEALAREALAEQIKSDRATEDQRHALEQSETALLQVREVRLHLQAQLEELNRRKKEIVTRARSAKKDPGIYQYADMVRMEGTAILDEVARVPLIDEENLLPSRIAQKRSGPFDRSLESRLRALEREAEIERRLASIKERKQSKLKLDA